MKFISFILVIEVFYTAQQMYDEDISFAFPMPVEITETKYFKSGRTINNCICREDPEVICCGGNRCENIPVSLKKISPIFKIIFTAISNITQNNLSEFTNLTVLHIDSNRMLNKIESGCFKNMSNLQNLSISFNENLRYLQKDIFDGLVNLRALRLKKNGFTHIPTIADSFAPNYLPNLILLDLSENIFREIYNEDFFAMEGTTLQQLNLVLCDIEYMESKWMAPFKNLSFLRLGQNPFNTSVFDQVLMESIALNVPLQKLNLYGMGYRKIIPRDLIVTISKMNITHLYLTNNFFEHIDGESFPKMPNIRTLSLSSNNIIDVTNTAFKKLTGLTNLYLSQNKLSIVSSAAMLTTLEELDLSANSNELWMDSFFYIPDGIFSKMKNLKILKLINNTVNYLTKSTFIGLTNLKRLNLRNTFLYPIEPGTFIHTPNLEYLNLNYNPASIPYSSVDSNMFIGLNKLKILLLAGCGITNLTMTPSLFVHTPNLIHLGLEKNGLLVISSNQLQHLTNLYSLNLADNNLTPWYNNIIYNGSLKFLFLSQNKLTHITASMLEEWKNMDTIDLEGNPIRCDCSLYPVVLWLKNKNYNYFKSLKIVAECLIPQFWRDRSTNLTNYISILYETEENDCESRLSSINISICLSFTFLISIFIYIICHSYRWYLAYWIFLLRISFWKKNKLELLNDNYKYDAFVSYSKEDKAFIVHLINMLENHEPYLKLCTYERDFEIGSPISNAIIENVAASKRTLLIISDSFAKSQWCRWETQLAKYHQIFFTNDRAKGPDDTLLMIRLHQVSTIHLTPILKYLMRTRIYLTWTTDSIKQQIFWAKLRAALASPKGKANDMLNI